MNNNKELPNIEVVKNYVYQFYANMPETQQDLHKLLAHFPVEDAEVVTTDTVYKPGNLAARRVSNSLVARLVLPGSKIINAHHLAKSWRLAQEGKSVLILCEHFSNFDLTNISYLTDHDPLIGEEFANKLIAMAGVKLSRDSDRFISSFIKIYNRIVIVPSRSRDQSTFTLEEQNEYKKINISALREMTKRKYSGHPILVFPTGTRTRPNEPDTAKAIKEIYGYIRSFDVVQFLSLNGLNLTVSAKHMSEDKPQANVIMIGASEPISSVDFLKQAADNCPSSVDIRDFIPEYTMQQLFSLHDYVEPIRKSTLGAI